MKLFETVYAFIIGVFEQVAYWYIRLYWPVALATGIFCLIAGENAIKQEQLPFTFADSLFVIAIFVMFILLTELWGILLLIEKLHQSRPPRHFRKDTER